MPILPLLITLAFVILWLTAVSNLLLFPRLNPKDRPATTPLVSILIPARNEARAIGRAVRSLLAQTYGNFEIVLLDDQSEDETAVLLDALTDKVLANADEAEIRRLVQLAIDLDISSPVMTPFLPEADS